MAAEEGGREECEEILRGEFAKKKALLNVSSHISLALENVYLD